ncbi:MAG TPA: carboxylating nicotinate-nucleotide diphosphorylase [Burkholderiales bacterium]|nr:carboxylating nicotinate-nucleotide diphosphorylase [Burkholderiales bacterium]
MNLSSAIRENVKAALKEDLGGGDMTARLIPANARAKATVITREAAVLCGTAWFEACFRKLDPKVKIRWAAHDGDDIQAGQALCEINGRARAMLTAERPALNFLQMLSATATLTRRYVKAVKGAQAAIMDTRKTLPGLRIAQKYAVRVGGGKNQRIGLFDGILIKENHIAAAGGITQALQQAKKLAKPGVSIQIEVENLQQLKEALSAGAKLILLDNLNLEQLREAARITGKRAQLEASGGVNLDNLRAIAETGVDRISIGSLTKDVKAIDLSMRFQVNK